MPRITAAVVVALALALAAPASAQDDADRVGDQASSYVGGFVVSSRINSRIVDVDGFANWGNPGSSIDYQDVGLVGGALLGRKIRIAGAPLFRIEVSWTFGDLLAMTNRLDPVLLDETAESEVFWIATASGGLENTIGRVTVFATGGLAIARIANSVTDIDFMPTRMDPDDSFRDVSTDLGWTLGIGVETSVADAWALRLDGSYLGFGLSTHEVNRAADFSCGPGKPHRPCPYDITHALGIVRLGIIYRFGR